MAELVQTPMLPLSEAQPLISVITIFLDAAPFMAEAIESVIGQRYPNWELLLVDDGSTDASTTIARGYARQHPQRIRYLEHPGHVNRGMSASRNAGVAAARGSLISFLDADDVWTPETLEQQVQTMMSQPRAGMAYAATEIWRSWTGSEDDVGHNFVRRLGIPTETLYEPPHLLTRFIAREARPPATCSLVVRRSALELIGGFDEQFRGLHEDQVIFVKLACALPIYVSGASWGRYRQHAASACAEAAANGRVGREQAIFLAWLGNYVGSHRFSDPEIRLLLRQKLWRYRHRTLYRLFESVTQRGLRVKRLASMLLGNSPWIAFEPALVPPRRMRRRGGSAIDEAWFRRCYAWMMILSLYGGLTPTSHILELDGGLGQIAYAVRYVLSADGSYTTLGVNQDTMALLAARYRYRYPNFRFDLADESTSRSDSGDGQLPMSYLPYPDDSFDIVILARALQHLDPACVAACVREVARVLQPGGTCLLETLLLDRYRSNQPRRGMFSDRAFDFDTRPADEFVSVQHGSGERIIAYRLRFLEQLAADTGLTVDGAPIVGAWSGSTPGWPEDCDLVVLRKDVCRNDGAGRGDLHSAVDVAPTSEGRQ